MDDVKEIVISNWQPFFCILPKITVSGNKTFMQKCYRRKVWRIPPVGIPEPEYQYGTIFDVLASSFDDEVF